MIIPAEARHVILIARNMRRDDRLEAQALGLSPFAATKETFVNSIESWTWTRGGIPAAMFGVGLDFIIGGTAKPWLITTPIVEAHPMEFLRTGRKVLNVMKSRYPVLENWVDARYEKCHRWLRWMGFTISEPAPYGPLGSMFCKFRLEA